MQLFFVDFSCTLRIDSPVHRLSTQGHEKFAHCRNDVCPHIHWYTLFAKRNTTSKVLRFFWDWVYLHLRQRPSMVFLPWQCWIFITMQSTVLGYTFNSVTGRGHLKYQRRCLFPIPASNQSPIRKAYRAMFSKNPSQTIMHCINPCIELPAENRFRLDWK